MTNRPASQTQLRNPSGEGSERTTNPNSVNDFRMPILHALAESSGDGLTVRQLELRASALADRAQWLADNLDVRFDFDLEALVEEGLVVLNPSKRLQLSPVAITMISGEAQIPTSDQ